MKSLNSLIDRFCYQHPRFGIPNLMLCLVIGQCAVFLLDMITPTGNGVSSLLSFSRGLILQGQIWRLITFLFIPLNSSPLWFLLSVYFYWMIGTQLEREWGTGKFTIYYGLGAVLSVILGLIMGSATASYINLSLFLAYATLYPDTQFLIFFIIPVKAKWLGWIDGALLAASFCLNLLNLQFASAVMVVASVLNYLIFFWPDLMYHFGRLRGQVRYSRQSNVVHFKKAARDLKKRDYIHKCTVCGRTDAEYPDLEFRYCSRCAGYHCYCADHINNHEHITE